MDGVCDGICDGVCDGVWLFGKDSFEECPLTIMVVIDSVTKRSHFVSTVTTLTASRTAQLYLQHIWKHHGFPRKVVSDRGPQFIVEFMKELYRLLGVKLATTTAYHPQGDGQMERVNQELEQFLHLFINQRQDDWDDLLPITEFQYNNHIHSATQNIPFLLYLTWDSNQTKEDHVEFNTARTIKSQPKY